MFGCAVLSQVTSDTPIQRQRKLRWHGLDHSLRRSYIAGRDSAPRISPQLLNTIRLLTSLQLAQRLTLLIQQRLALSLPKGRLNVSGHAGASVEEELSPAVHKSNATRTPRR